MGREKYNELISCLEDDASVAKSISDEIVSKYTSELDGLMRRVNEDIIKVGDVPDTLLSSYLMELTNAMYFYGTKADELGMYADIAKSKSKISYNKAYVENQINNATKSKPTVAENQIYAENTTIDENTVSLIYSRAVNIVKAKIDSAKEMIRTISKIISKRQSDEQLSGISGGVN